MTCTVLVADPPWAFRDKLPGETRGASSNYSTLVTDGRTHEQRRADLHRSFIDQQASRSDTALVLVFVAIVVVFAAVSIAELAHLRDAVKACAEVKR